ncbi:hypothetical protein Tco_0145002 [Tanacetum coccineum]
MGDVPLSTILETESDEVIKSSVDDLVLIPSEFKGISDDICDMPFCDNDHFDAECGLIDSLLSRYISITSPKSDFIPEEFAGELDLIDPILSGTDEDNFNEEKGAIDIDILQIEDEILREKLLNVNLLIDKIEALNLTPSIPFVLKYPSSSPIPVVDSDFLIEEVDTFLVSKDSIPPGIESDFDSEGDIIFLNDLLNDDPIPEYERFTFDIEPDTAVINNFDELNEDESFDPGEVRLFFPQMLKMTIPSHFSFELFSRFSPTLRILLYFSPPGVKTPFLTPTSPLRTGGVSSGWNFHDCPDFEGSRARCFVHRSLALQSLACLYWESDIQILSTNVRILKKWTKEKTKLDKTEHENEKSTRKQVQLNVSLRLWLVLLSHECSRIVPFIPSGCSVSKETKRGVGTCLRFLDEPFELQEPFLFSSPIPRKDTIRQ